MIGDDAMAGGLIAVRCDAAQIGGCRNQMAEQIGFEDAVNALQHRGDALEPHARVDRRFRQGRARAARMLLELHEDEIPHFDKTIAVFVR